LGRAVVKPEPGRITGSAGSRAVRSTIGKTRTRLRSIQARPVAILAAIGLTGPSRARQQAKQAMSNDLRDERRCKATILREDQIFGCTS
jgi:hypothetical protein